jgi:hypothetical protein
MNSLKTLEAVPIQQWQKRSNRERMPNEEGSLELGEVKRLKTVLEQVREAWSEG